MIIRVQEQEEDCVTEERNIKKCEEKPTVNENTDGKEQQKQQQQQHTTIRTHTVIFAKHKEETKGTIHQSVSHSTAISGCGNVCNFLSHQLYRISDSDRISSIHQHFEQLKYLFCDRFFLLHSIKLRLLNFFKSKHLCAKINWFYSRKIEENKKESY